MKMTLFWVILNSVEGLSQESPFILSNNRVKRKITRHPDNIRRSNVKVRSAMEVNHDYYK